MSQVKTVHSEEMLTMQNKRAADAAEMETMPSALDTEKKKHQDTIKRAKTAMDNDITGAGWEKVRRLFSKSGGLSRWTLFNDDWHEEHKDAAKRIWGYPSWQETKYYVEAYFPQSVYNVDTSYDPSKFCKFDKEGNLVLPDMTQFEQCLLGRMFFRTFTEQEVLPLIFDKHRTRIGHILDIWGPRWGNVGEDLCCIDITRDYISKEVPDINLHLGRQRLVNLDGKNALISQKCNDSTVSKATWSSKNEKDCTG